MNPAASLDCIALIELNSIARGLFVSDAMIKKAPVKLLLSKTISPGKYLVLVSGDVASCQESSEIGIELAQNFLEDSLFIPNIHPHVVWAIENKLKDVKFLSLGIVETHSVASTIAAADQALKTARVNLVKMKLGQGLGGKGYFIVSGELSEIEAAIFSAEKVLEGTAKLLKTEIIPRPHEEFKMELTI